MGQPTGLCRALFEVEGIFAFWWEEGHDVIFIFKALLSAVLRTDCNKDHWMYFRGLRLSIPVIILNSLFKYGSVFCLFIIVLYQLGLAIGKMPMCRCKSFFFLHGFFLTVLCFKNKGGRVGILTIGCYPKVPNSWSCRVGLSAVLKITYCRHLPSCRYNTF